MCHVVGLHDFARPFPSLGVQLVDLEPAASNTSVGRGVGDGLEEVCDWAWVARVVPLHLDAVAGFGVNGLDSRIRGTGDVACHVIGCHVLDGAVVGWHPDADLVAWSGVVDPELVEILVSGGGGHEGCSEEGLGQHLQ